MRLVFDWDPRKAKANLSTEINSHANTKKYGRTRIVLH